MKSPTILVATCFLGCAVLLGQSLENGTAPGTWLSESFEPPLPADPPWQVLTGNAGVSNDSSVSGNYSLKIEATVPPGQVAFNLPQASVDPVTFVDFRLLPVAGNTTTAAASADAAGAQIGFLQVRTDGEVYAYDAGSGGQWMATGLHLSSGPNGALTQWVRLTLRLDHTAGTWDLYVNGAMVKGGLGLDPGSGGQLVLFGETSTPVYVDDVSIGVTNPLFVDADGDGLPDAWVLAQTGGASLPANARGWSSAGSGVTLLELYLQTVAKLSESNPVYSQPVILVHPTIRSYGDLATLLNTLNTAYPIRDTGQQNYLTVLGNALINAQQLALAGLQPPIWQYASDVVSAAQIAPNGATIVVFPCNSPYVAEEIDTPDKQVTFDYLPGTVLSDPDQVNQALTVIAQLRGKILTELTAGFGGTKTATDVANLWPSPVTVVPGNATP